MRLPRERRTFTSLMPIIEITSLSMPELDVYRSLTEAQLRGDKSHDAGIFVAESPKVICVALNAGYKPMSLLCERKHITGDAKDIVERCSDIPVYTGDRAVLASLTGYTLTRGVLCAMRRPAPLTVDDVCGKGTKRIAVIVDVCDTTNTGAIFRSAAALGIDGVLLSPTACDPLNRRAVRVSMGTVLLIPWAYIDGQLIPELHQRAFKTVALALSDDSIPIDDGQLMAEERLAMIVGTEGDGLPSDIIRQADYVARIPMSRHVDSLNVGAAAAIAFWQLRRKDNNSME